MLVTRHHVVIVNRKDVGHVKDEDASHVEHQLIKGATAVRQVDLAVIQQDVGKKVVVGTIVAAITDLLVEIVGVEQAADVRQTLR